MRSAAAPSVHHVVTARMMHRVIIMAVTHERQHLASRLCLCFIGSLLH